MAPVGCEEPAPLGDEHLVLSTGKEMAGPPGDAQTALGNVEELAPGSTE
jgi:hypothetical protein